MKLRARIFNFLIVCLTLFAGQARAQTAFDVYGTAHVLDPLQDQDQRPQVSGAYRSPFGSQVHKACFKYAEKYGVSRAKAEQNFESFIKEAVEKILACRTKYSEFDPYLLDVLTQLRRVVFLCMQKTVKETGFGAASLRDGRDAEAVHSKEELEGLDIAPFDPLVRQHEPMISIPMDELASIINKSASPPHSYVIDSFIHESLHATEANNKFGKSHALIEAIPMDYANRCEPNRLDDRIVAIANLCSGYAWEMPFKTDEQIFDRVNKCGMGRGCIALFTSTTNPITRIYTPSKALSNTDALRVCEKIVDNGTCTNAVRVNGEKITLDHPELVEFKERFKKKLAEFEPPRPHSISKAMLDAFGPYRDGLRSLGATDCFKALFKTEADGSLTLQGEDHTLLKPKKKLFVKKLQESGAKAFDFFEDAKERIESFPPEQCDGMNSPSLKLVSMLDEFSGAVKDVFQSKFMTDKILPRANDEAEKDYAANTSDSDTLLLRSMIGPALFDEYAAALKRDHAKSPDFDCKAANLSPHATAHEAGDMLMLLQNCGATPEAKCKLQAH